MAGPPLIPGVDIPAPMNPADTVAASDTAAAAEAVDDSDGWAEEGWTEEYVPVPGTPVPPPPPAGCDCPFSWLADGYCDGACNKEACEFDRGDCEGIPPPQPPPPGCWEAAGGQCPTNYLGDGYCDSGCNNEACEFDRGDCEGIRAPPPGCGCPAHYLGDNYCDGGCNNEACEFDWGDCGSPDPYEATPPIPGNTSNSSFGMTAPGAAVGAPMNAAAAAADAATDEAEAPPDAEAPHHAAAAETATEHLLLRVFEDFLGPRKRTTQALRALLIKKKPLGSRGQAAGPKLRKVMHHAHRRHHEHRHQEARRMESSHHRRGRKPPSHRRSGRVLNNAPAQHRRSKRFLLNQAPLTLAEFGAELRRKNDSGLPLEAQLLDQLCTPCMDLVLSEAAGLAKAFADFFGEHSHIPPFVPDLLRMAQYLPTACIRAASSGQVCVTPVLSAAEAWLADGSPDDGRLKDFATPEAVCGECGLSRARAVIDLAALPHPATQLAYGVPAHPLFTVAGFPHDRYLANWELDHACEGKGEAREDICLVPALAFLTEIFGNASDGAPAAQTRAFTTMAMKEHIHACLHSLGKEQPWLHGLHDQFVHPSNESSTCHPACQSWLSSLQAEHGCCAPHLAAQHFAYSCGPAFSGSCMQFSPAEADAVVAEIAGVCEFDPPPCPSCGDALVFVVPAPAGEATDLSANNTHRLAEALRSDLAVQTGEQVHVTIRALDLMVSDEGAYFLEAKSELGSAPCWRSQFVGDQLRREVENGTLSFAALT
ncbi:MAG: hypothetical protein CML43_13995, partial [Rhodobacteraceae bacterium]|nr:hypothetical protein [Paracoccaceae bacterium]